MLLSKNLGNLCFPESIKEKFFLPNRWAFQGVESGKHGSSESYGI